MKWYQKFLKAFVPQQPNLGGTSWLQRPMFSNTRYDYVAEAGDTWTNSVVSICLNRKSSMLNDLTLTVQRWSEKKQAWEEYSDVRTAQVLKTFRKPNDYYSLSELIYATTLNDDCRGHSVMVKRRNLTGQVIGYWILPYTNVQLMSDRDNPDGTKLITYVRYSTIGGAQQDIPIADCVIVRQGIDPRDGRSGLSPLLAQLREICTDNEAGTRMAGLLRNGPDGIIVSPKTEVVKSTVEQFKQLAEKLNNMIRDAVGRTTPIMFPVDVNHTSLKPSDMDLGNLRRVPVDRICAALGGDPMAFGLPSESKTYNNLEEAMDALGNMTIIPAAARWCEQWSRQILPDFNLDPEMFRLAFIPAGCYWLRDETLERDKNTRENFTAGILTLAEAREQIGVPSSDADKGVNYFTLQALARGPALPSDAQKKTIRPDILRMAAANIERLEKLGRMPGVIVRKPNNKGAAAQAQHDRLIAEMERDMLKAFRSYGDGRLAMAQLQEKQNALIYDFHRAMYRLGYQTGGGTPTDEMLDVYAQLVTDGQSGYMLGFLDDIANGRYNDDDGKLDVDGPLKTRTGLYSLQSSSSASAGFVQGSPDDEEFDWTLGPTEHCEDCLYISGLGPFDKETIFTNPRKGDTVCLGNCACRWVRSDGLSPFGPP